MHKELTAFFDQHASPTHIAKPDIHAGLSPVARLAAKVQQQVLEYRVLIAEAEMAPHDQKLDGKLEMMHQTFGAMERESAALSSAARNLAQCATQLDRYMGEWQADIHRFENPPTAPTT